MDKQARIATIQAMIKNEHNETLEQAKFSAELALHNQNWPGLIKSGEMGLSVSLLIEDLMIEIQSLRDDLEQEAREAI